VKVSTEQLEQIVTDLSLNYLAAALSWTRWTVVVFRARQTSSSSSSSSSAAAVYLGNTKHRKRQYINNKYHIFQGSERPKWHLQLTALVKQW